MRSRTLILLTALALVPAAIAGCGDSDDDGGSSGGSAATGTPAETTTTEATTTPSSTSASKAITIKMSEFKFDPKDSTAKAGNVSITAPNEGKVVHELVILRTDTDPAKLPKKGGKVDESTSIGELADVEPGKSKSAMFALKPGKYALVCALPGHYESGMYGSLTVTK